ncbi:MAG: zinc-ribbon domain-containing protein [Saccharofermentanales bacterium]|jgi:hypothetical protein
MRKCTQCGADISEGERFCGNCGKSIMVTGADGYAEPEADYSGQDMNYYTQDSDSQAYSRNYYTRVYTQDSDPRASEDNSYAYPDYQTDSSTPAYEQYGSEPNYPQDPETYAYSAAYESDWDYSDPVRIVDENSLPEKYKPLSVLSYVGYGLLFIIPLVGLMLAIVFAISDKKINRRNFARSMIIINMLVLILALAGFIIFKDIIYSLIGIFSNL